MAEDNDAASKTEEPSGKKLEQARQKGEVVKTPDLPAMASLAAGAAVVAISGGTLARNLGGALTPFLAHPDEFNLEGASGVAVMHQAIMAAAPFMGIVMVAVMVAGVAGNLVQTGFMFTPSKLEMDFSKLNPLSGFKRLFNPDGLMQFAKSLVKVTVTAEAPVVPPLPQEYGTGVPSVTVSAGSAAYSPPPPPPPWPRTLTTKHPGGATKFVLAAV